MNNSWKKCATGSALPLLAGLLLFFVPAPPGATLSAGEYAHDVAMRGGGAGEFSPAGAASPFRVTISPASAVEPANMPPKTLEGLRRSVGRGYICLERDRYLVASNLDPDECEYLVDGVLDFCSRALADTYFTTLPKEPSRMVNIYVFRDYDSYASGLKRWFDMEPISPYGHFGNSQRYVVVNYETGPGTMVHELTHALMAEDFPEAPIWISEGLASLYEQCRAEGNAIKGEPNWRLPELKAAVAAGTAPTLARLVAMTPAAFRANNESLHYAQARYFCKYLEELGLLPRVYRDFRDNHRLDPTGARFISRAVGKSLSTIDQEWRNWLGYQSWKEK